MYQEVHFGPPLANDVPSYNHLTRGPISVTVTYLPDTGRSVLMDQGDVTGASRNITFISSVDAKIIIS